MVSVPRYDALLVVSFGGPERPEEVLPFLERVTGGRGIPRERLLEVAGHYHHFGGRSPINDQNRALIAALRSQIGLPVYWGNRNWHPFLADTLREMRKDGIPRALAFITSAFGSYSGCRQYLEDIEKARVEVGEGAPIIDRLPLFHDHSGFLEPMVENTAKALAALPGARLVFTAHSIPLAMASSSPYVQQLQMACRAVAEGAGVNEWTLVYQSRSGSPRQPWLEPDICDYLRANPRDSVIVPIGFISDHLEVLYDLDTEARAVCEELGIRMVRAATVGTHPKFISMIRESVERTEIANCPADCCVPGRS